MALTRNRLIGNLANATDSAASSSFLAKGATEANYQGITYSDVTGKPTILDSSGIISIIDSAYIQARQGSAVAGLDSAGITSLIDSNYIVARAAAGNSGYGRYKYTATAGQTVFQGSDNNGATLSYTSGGIMVFYNGVMLKNTVDWEGTDGSSVTLVEAADSGANVSIHKWTVAGSSGSSGGAAVWYGDRGLYAGGTGAGTSNQIEYISVNISSNASDFGDLTVSRGQMGAASNGTRAVWAGGYDYGNSIRENTMDYVTVATTSNALDFGDLTEIASGAFHSVVGDGTYGFRCGGFVGSSRVTTIDSWTLDTTGNASDHGDLTVAKSYVGAACDGTYGVVAGGNDAVSFYLNTIDTFTTATASNASDFGDLQNGKYNIGVGYDTTRAVFAAGWTASGGINVIDYVTMATPSNASDFGDLTAGEYPAGTSDGTYVCFATGTGLGANIHQITIQTLGNAVDTGYDLITSYSNGSGGVSGSSS